MGACVANTEDSVRKILFYLVSSIFLTVKFRLKSKAEDFFMFRKKHVRILSLFVSSFLAILIAVLLIACGAGGGGGNADSDTTNNNESNSIGPNGGTVTSSDGKAKIVISPGSLSQDTGITVAAVSNAPSGNIGTAYEFGPDGTTFNEPVTISITYNKTFLPSDVSELDIKLGMVTNNQWQEITNSVVDTVANIVSGTTSHLSTYGVMVVSSSGTVPATPTDVAAAADDGKATISWNAVSGATSYYVYWATTSGVSKTSYTGKITGATSPYPHTGLTNGTTYYYVVTAINGYGESSESSQVSATPQATDTTTPNNPTSTTGYSSTSKTLALTSGNWYNYATPYFEWNGASDSSSGVAGYYVYFGIDATADPAISGTYQTSANYTVSTSLTSGSIYYLLIKARDNAGNIAADTYTAFTYQYDSLGPTNTTGSNFIDSGASSANSTTVTLTLSATDNTVVTGYCAKELSAAPPGNDTCWTSITSTISYSAGATFTLSSGEGTKTVYVWFKDAAGNISSAANDSIILGSPPSAPTGVTPSVGDGQVTISWNAVSGATSYNIYWSTTSGVTKSTGTKISNVTSPYTHSGRTNGAAYYYVVTAVNDFGESVESSQVSAIPQAPIRLPKTGQTTSYATGDDGDLKRGVAWPSPRFTDNGDGTVTDNLTSLAWTKDANAPEPAACSSATPKRGTWQGALNYVACLNTNNYLGYTDWRLPNINELVSLVNKGQTYPGAWLNTQGLSVWGSFWSSTTSAGYSQGRALIVSMDTGWVGNDYKSGQGGYYGSWPVRSGQSGVIQLLKTGQTTCYDSSGNVIACAGTGQDGDIQAGSPWPIPRFTDNGNGAITDNLTGLIWTKDANAPGPAACSPATPKTWQGALNYVACLNTNNYLGYTDWRLPNINELKSLVNKEQTDPGAWLNTQGFTNVQSYSSLYWSSTTHASYSSDCNSCYAWVVYMYYGDESAGLKSSDYSYTFNYYAWPVRSGQ